MPFPEGEIWHCDGRAYRLVNQQAISYARSEIRKIDGRNVRVPLPPLEYTIVTAELIGDDVPAASPAQKSRAPQKQQGRKLVQSARKR